MRIVLALVILLPLGCGPGLPDLDDQLSANARASGFPTLVPLGPLLAQAEAPLPRAAATEGSNLDARVADLRRRADWLRNMPL